MHYERRECLDISVKHSAQRSHCLLSRLLLRDMLTGAVSLTMLNAIDYEKSVRIIIQLD